MPRNDARPNDQLRPITITGNFTPGELTPMFTLATTGCQQLFTLQRQALAQ